MKTRRTLPAVGSIVALNVRGLRLPSDVLHGRGKGDPLPSVLATYHSAEYMQIAACCFCCCVVAPGIALVEHGAVEEALRWADKLRAYAGFVVVDGEWVCRDCADPPL